MPVTGPRRGAGGGSGCLARQITRISHDTALLRRCLSKYINRLQDVWRLSGAAPAVARRENE